MHDAAKVGDVAALERLIQDGADVNEQARASRSLCTATRLGVLQAWLSFIAAG